MPQSACDINPGFVVFTNTIMTKYWVEKVNIVISGQITKLTVKSGGNTNYIKTH